MIKKYYILTIIIGFMLSVQSERNSPPDFSDWLNKEFRPLALKKGIREDTFNRAFKDITPASQSDRTEYHQPPLMQDFVAPKEKRLPPRIVTAKKKAKKYRRILDTIQSKYGVPKEVILALWGIESNFGRDMGECLTIHTLATLAFEGRRREFYATELVEALRILQTNNMDTYHLKGSMTGSLGQCQFMPSAFNTHAVDFLNKGYKDIWNSVHDVFASIANYLAHFGWKTEEPWGIEVTLPPKFDKNLATLSLKKPKEYWVSLGIRASKKDALIPQLVGSLVISATQKKAFLVYNNFRVILRWNNSIPFAINVCKFAEEIRSDT